MQPRLTPDTDSGKPRSGHRGQVRQPTQAEWKLIEQWVLLGNAFGVPKSVSRIYGLMFTAPDALSANECVAILKISRSSAGQGIRLLLEHGAIKPLLAIGKREESYVIEPGVHRPNRFIQTCRNSISSDGDH